MPNKVGFNENYPVIEESNHWYERGSGLIPSMTQTLAKGPTQYVQGVSPVYLQKGSGSHVWDVDGNEYIDYNMGIGPISLGYAYPAVDAAIQRQLEDGITFSLMHPLEVEVAELLGRVIPNAEAVRYSKNGADVTSAAIRVARAFTGKDKILCCGYHGWHDWYSHLTPRKGGIPRQVQDLTFTFNYNDIESLEKAIDQDTAAVILEPVVFEAPENNFLQEVAEVCRVNHIVLIFDEMWTGFRSLVSFDQSDGDPLEMKSLVQQEMIKRGILWSGFHNMCFSHSDKDIDYTLDVYRDVLPLLKKAVQEGNVGRYLKGRPVQPVFRKTSGFNTKPGKRNE